MADKAKKLAAEAHRAEKAVSHRAAAHRDTAPVQAAGLVAELADQPQLIAIALATIGAGAAMRRGDLVRGGSRMLAAHLTATALKTAIKHRVDRSRPEHELDGNPGTLRKGRSHDHELNSFPSGHTAGAVAAALAVSRDIDGAALPATLAAGAVAAVQPATGSHHLSDVIVGGLVGWLSEALVSAAFDRIEPVIEQRVVQLIHAYRGEDAPTAPSR
jgi:membrane-associated phospholipid phosphatase